jgi:hypothetical protein
VSRLAIQILFVVLAVLWFAYSAMTFLGATLGDCFDVQLCSEIKKVSVGLVFWRWLAGCLILFGAYRFFRKEPE